MSGKIVFVTGGARSGKSCFAEAYAARTGRRVAYIATAQCYDEEMRLRVAQHQARRPVSWDTYEAPTAAEQVITAAAAEHETILFDCLTLYASNLLCTFTEAQLADMGWAVAQVQAAGERLFAAAQASGRTVIFVSNEVGQGIVPMNQLARVYRDAQGLLNQRFAAAADEAYLTVSGIAIDLKRLAVPY